MHERRELGGDATRKQRRGDTQGVKRRPGTLSNMGHSLSILARSRVSSSLVCAQALAGQTKPWDKRGTAARQQQRQAATASRSSSSKLQRAATTAWLARRPARSLARSLTRVLARSLLARPPALWLARLFSLVVCSSACAWVQLGLGLPNGRNGCAVDARAHARLAHRWCTHDPRLGES